MEIIGMELILNKFMTKNKRQYSKKDLENINSNVNIQKIILEKNI